LKKLRKNKRFSNQKIRHIYRLKNEHYSYKVRTPIFNVKILLHFNRFFLTEVLLD